MSLTMVLQGLHVFFGVLWFGGDMFNTFVVVPAANSIDASHANAFLVPYGKYAERLQTPTGAATILLGILLGFKEGAWSQIGQPFGNTYLASMILAILIWLGGVFFLGRRLKQAMSFGVGTPGFVAIIDKVKKYAALQLLAFLALFVMMVALRYGR